MSRWRQFTFNWAGSARNSFCQVEFCKCEYNHHKVCTCCFHTHEIWSKSDELWWHCRHPKFIVVSYILPFMVITNSTDSQTVRYFCHQNFSDQTNPDWGLYWCNTAAYKVSLQSAWWNSLYLWLTAPPTGQPDGGSWLPCEYWTSSGSEVGWLVGITKLSSLFPLPGKVKKVF